MYVHVFPKNDLLLLQKSTKQYSSKDFCLVWIFCMEVVVCHLFFPVDLSGKSEIFLSIEKAEVYLCYLLT